ncbi:hypothetical protein EDD99_5608 [Streptomyces sp. 846.5]|nr:hypothetical protein [Streptomyces sp. 846.5]TDT97470.1 hypothetical protein EDD99_5608 [Streptomyces sp. 846.5]
MFVQPLVLPVLLLLIGGVLLALIPGRSPAAELGAHSRFRPGELARWAGLVLGVVLAWWASRSGPLGMGPMLAPVAFGTCAVLGVLSADALTPRQRGAVRTASLMPRRIRNYLPVRLTAVLAGFAATLVALLVATTATGSADDLGRAGRSFTYACGAMIESRSPWPGSYYSVPLLAAIAAATAVCSLALCRMARRPAAGEPGTPQMDDGRRRVGMTDVVAAWGLLVTGSLTGIGLVVEVALHGLPCAGTATQAASWALLPTVIVAAVTALHCLAILCGIPGRRL